MQEQVIGAFFLMFYFIALMCSLAIYVITGISLQRMGKTVGADKPWLAWIPIANAYALGLIADKCCEKKGKNSKYRFILLGMEIGIVVITIIFSIVLIAFVVSMSMDLIEDQLVSPSVNQIMEAGGGALLLLYLLFIFLLSVVSIAYSVFTYICLWHIFETFVPQSGVMFLVLSILFSVTLPFFLLYASGKKPAVFTEPEVYTTDDTGDHYLSF